MEYIKYTNHTHTHSTCEIGTKERHSVTVCTPSLLLLLLLLISPLLPYPIAPLFVHCLRHSFILQTNRHFPKKSRHIFALLWWNGKRVFKRERWQCMKLKRSINHFYFLVVIVRVWERKWVRCCSSAWCMESMNLLFSVRNNILWVSQRISTLLWLNAIWSIWNVSSHF